MSTKDNQLQLLRQNREMLESATQWLKRSLQQCKHMTTGPSMPEREFDQLEALGSRYARTVDILFNRLFRSIMHAEMQPGQSLLDTVLFMQKQGVVDSLEQAKYLKDLRNDLVHEYIFDDIRAVYQEVLKASPDLLRIVEAAMAYAQRLEGRYNQAGSKS